MNKYRVYTKEGTFVVVAAASEFGNGTLEFIDDNNTVIETFNWDYVYRVELIESSDDTNSMAGAPSYENPFPNMPSVEHIINDMQNVNLHPKNCLKICDCYHQRWVGKDKKHLEIVGECWGTKERDECRCGGDPECCDFYPEKRGEV